MDENCRRPPRHLVPLLEQHAQPGRLESGGESHDARAGAEQGRPLRDGRQGVLGKAGGVGEDQVSVGPVALRLQERALYVHEWRLKQPGEARGSVVEPNL